MEWYHWLISILLFLIIPLSIIFMRIATIKTLGNNQYNKREMLCGLIKSTLFYWLLGAFHLCAVFGVLPWVFIFGCVALIIIFFNLVKFFLRQENVKQVFYNVALLQDFIVGLIVTIYLIYIIPEDLKVLQTIVMTIVSAVYGGLLTLVGVVWTIQFTKDERIEQDKKRDEERRTEERKKYRPVFNIYHGEYRSFVDAHFEDFNGIHEIGYGYLGSINREHQVIIEDFILENSCFTEFYIRGVKINNKKYDRDRNLFIKKEAYVQFDLDHMPLNLSEIFQTISLIVEDLLGNVYEVSLDTEIELKDGIRHVEIKGNRRIKI